MKQFFLLLIGLFWSLFAHAQTEKDFETDTVITRKIAQWQDLKFGFMMHWGTYSQWGVVESWSICSEDEDWCSRGGKDYNEYVKQYKQLKETFNPVLFNPEKWAQAAYEAGMRYVVFTAKHHDGFCMFDSKQTNYKITDKNCPFSSNPKSDITKEIFNAFRNKNFWIGAYFSKPDWNSDDYWAHEWATPDRNVNYDPKKHPERWERFCQFTYEQIKELMSNYGKIDILWLDGGWVRPEWSLNEETRPWIGCKGWIQDINMEKIAGMARQKQKNLLIVDRTVHGKYENYRTPEQQIPEKEILDYPWETCMSMASSWSYSATDTYKSTNKLIHTLADVVSKGGNLLLNVGPGSDGELHPDAYNRMKEIGEWMKINEKAIYQTRPVAPYKNGKVRFTRLPDGTIFAIYLADKDETQIPSAIELGNIQHLKAGNIRMLGSKYNVKLKKTESGKWEINIPKDLQQNPPCKNAWVFDLGKQSHKN